MKRLMTEPRRFPPPWTIEDKNACFIVKDRGGQALAYVKQRTPIPIVAPEPGFPAGRFNQSLL
jgi:hypothetical protein